MGNIDDLDFPTPDYSEDDAETPESDPATVAHLDQQQEQYNTDKAIFAKVYGFAHECRCAEDYTAGKTLNVTECFVGLVNDALARCAEASYENRMLTVYLEQMLQMNNDLAKMLQEFGHEAELEKYFTETLEIEDAEGVEDLSDLAPEAESTDESEDESDEGLTIA